MRILYVEDSDDLRSIQCEMLVENGFDHVAVGTAEAAEALFEECRFDLLLADVSLPQVSGIELARRLRLRRPDLWVIFLSGYDVGPLAERDTRTRAFLKPVDEDELLACLQGLAAATGLSAGR